MSKIFATFLLILACGLMAAVSGQQIAPAIACTSSLISSFTPCFNYITGSTNGGGSPTSDCCNSLGSLISSSADCACLILTGNVPLSIPINRTLAISLPRVCKHTKVPLKCKAAGAAAPLPGQGPVSYGPSLPPLPPSSLTPIPTQPVNAPAPMTFDGPPTIADSPTNTGQRPIDLVPSSAMKLEEIRSPLSLLLLAFSAILVKF